MADVTFTFSGDATSLQNALNEIKGEIGKTKESVQGLAGQFAASFAAIGAAIAAVKGAFATLGGISSAAAAMEQTGLAFKVMMGDAAAAAEYVEKLRVYAAETPFEFGDISDAGKTLLSMGTAAEKSIEVIRKLGDIASVSGKPLKELAFLYAKVQNSGLSNEVAESLEMQGVPIRKLIAEMRGISFEDVFKGISKRRFNLSDLDAALDKLTGAGGLLENMTLRQSQTFSGMLSTLIDGFNALAVELGTPINAAMMPVMQELTAYLESITPQVQEFAQGIASCFTGIVDVISPIISGIGSLVEMLGGAKTVVASLAAAMLMYVGNSKAANASTVSLRGSMASLVTTMKGLNMTTFVAGFKSAMTGIRSAMAASLTGMKVMWSTAWTTMATVTRAAMVAVKAAIVSTGIGLIIVGIGEALGALYSWFMGNSEAAKEAAQSAREFEKSLKGLNKRASKITTHEQYEDFIESLDEQIADLQSRRNEARAEEKDELVKALDRQMNALQRKRAEYSRIIPLQIEAAEAAEREAAAARAQTEAQEELRKKIEATQQRMLELRNQQHETEREYYLSGQETEMQIRLRLSDAGGFQSLEELQKAIRDMENSIGWANVGDDARYERLIKAYNKIMELRRQHYTQERREQQRQQEEAEKAQQTAEETTRDYADRMALLQAEIAQDEKKLEILKRQQRIVELTADYRRKGLEDAEQLARQMVEAELNAEIAREKNREKQKRSATRMSDTWIQGSQAGVGGGGRSYLIGGGPIQQLQEVRNAIRCYEESGQWDAYFVDDMLKAHRCMMEGLCPRAGAFRSGGVGVFAGDKLIHMAPPAHMVPTLMQQLFTWLAIAEDHLLIKSCVFHYEFEFIHPFSDGNGRIGRLWQSMILGKLHPAFPQLPVENMVYASQSGYYKAIEESSKLSDCSPFIDFMLGEILKTLKQSTAESPFLTASEQNIIQFMRADASISARQLAEQCGISARQIEKYIAELKKKGVLQRKGARKNGKWKVLLPHNLIRFL